MSLVLLIGHIPVALSAQASPSLTLSDARLKARRVSPDVTAARETVAAARGRERQSAVYQNPRLSFNREQSSGGGQSNSQNIALVEQPLEIGGARAARREIAIARREAAEGRLAAVEAQLDLDLTRVYATVLAADRRAVLADHASAAFTDAIRISERRLAAGDVSAYAHRRLKLEAARYAALGAEAALARRSARVVLASLLAVTADSIAITEVVLAETLPTRARAYPTDSLFAMALRGRAELRVADADGRAAQAEARLAASERTPVPVVSGGLKTERVATAGGVSQGLRGFAVGVTVPLPLWDRRAGAIEAADAEARRRAADTEAQRRRVGREVAEAYDALQAAEAQIRLLAPQLGAESAAALRAAQVAYDEGEITLVDWLDAVRAYREAEASFATLQAELLIRRAALERAVGSPMSPESPSNAPRIAPGAPQGTKP